MAMNCPKCGAPVANINEHHAGCPDSGSELPDLLNPLAVVGHNEPPPLPKLIGLENDFGAMVTLYLNDEYRELERSIEETIVKARELITDPETGKLRRVQSPDDVSKFVEIIKKLRDLAKRAEAIRVKEKEPYRRGEEAIDAKFFGWIDRLAKRDKKNNDGAADILLKMVDDYNQEQLRLREIELRRIADEAAKKARDEAAALAAAEETARLAREAADRARKPERIQEKAAVADVAEQTVDQRVASTTAAVETARSAHVDTLKTPAQIMRTRTAGGDTVTMARENYSVIEDESKLDKEALWPFISLDAKQKALNAYARTTNYAKPMAGAQIGNRPKTRV